MTLAEVWKKIEAAGGPHAIMLTRNTFEALPIALQKNPDLTWDFIYIRNDGWSLGADFYLSHYAEALFAGQWIAVVRRGDKKPRPLRNVVDIAPALALP